MINRTCHYVFFRPELNSLKKCDQGYRSIFLDILPPNSILIQSPGLIEPRESPSYSERTLTPTSATLCARLTRLWTYVKNYTDSKVHGAHVGPFWGRQDPGGRHVGLMNFAIWVAFNFHRKKKKKTSSVPRFTPIYVQICPDWYKDPYHVDSMRPSVRMTVCLSFQDF